MSRRLRRYIVNIFALSAALALVGGHWAALQMVAWTGMLWSYSSEASIITAVEKTFSGQNPCELCKTISKGRSSEQDEPKKIVHEWVKVDAVLESNPKPVELSFAEMNWRPIGLVGELRLEDPPVPPPRS
jgi:hypothetical protein